MRSKLLVGTAVALCFSFAIGITTSPVANALSGDGTSWVNCNGRWTAGYRAWGNAKMWLYACSNGYVFTHVNSSTTYAKSAGIIRDNPYAERWSSTTGYSYYATTTNMLKLARGTCYSAKGYSSDSYQYGTQTIRWCYW